MIATIQCSRLLGWLLVVMLAAPAPVAAQPGGSAAAFTPEQLEQVAAPAPTSLMAALRPGPSARPPRPSPGPW